MNTGVKTVIISAESIPVSALTSVIEYFTTLGHFVVIEKSLIIIPISCVFLEITNWKKDGISDFNLHHFFLYLTFFIFVVNTIVCNNIVLHNYYLLNAYMLKDINFSFVSVRWYQAFYWHQCSSITTLTTVPRHDNVYVFTRNNKAKYRHLLHIIVHTFERRKNKN